MSVNFHKSSTNLAKLYTIFVNFSTKSKRNSIKVQTSVSITLSHFPTSFSSGERVEREILSII